MIDFKHMAYMLWVAMWDTLTKGLYTNWFIWRAWVYWGSGMIVILKTSKIDKIALFQTIMFSMETCPSMTRRHTAQFMNLIWIEERSREL